MVFSSFVFIFVASLYQLQGFIWRTKFYAVRKLPLTHFKISNKYPILTILMPSFQK